MMILLTALLVMASGANMEKRQGFVSLKTGLSVEKTGQVVFTKSSALTSVLVRFPSISPFKVTRMHTFNEKFAVHFFPNCLDTEISSVRYAMILSGTFSENADWTSEQSELFSYWKNIIDFAIKRADEFKTSRTSLLSPYINIFNKSDSSTHSKDRVRRSLLSFLGGALSLAIGGLEELQIHKLSSHLSDFDDEISTIKSQLLAGEESVTSLKGRIFGFAKTVERSFNTVLTSESCNSMLHSFELEIHEYFSTVFSMIDNTLATALDGSNSLPLSSKMLDSAALLSLVNSHSSLASTIFVDQPNILYSLATVSLVDVDLDFTLAHLVLDIPIIHAVNIKPLYTSSQVGTTSHTPDYCYYIEISDHLFYNGSSFIGIDTNKCQKNNNLFVCEQAQSLDLLPSCHQLNTSTCTLIKKPCAPFQFHSSGNGILLRNSRADVFVRDTNNVINYVPLSHTDTAHVHWHGVTSIQISDTVIASPTQGFSVNLTESNLLEIIEDSVISIPFSTYNVTQVLEDACSSLNLPLDQILNPMINNWANGSSHLDSHTLLSILISVSIFLNVSLLIWITLLTVKIRPLQSRLASLESKSKPKKTVCLKEFTFPNNFPSMPEMRMYPSLPNISGDQIQTNTSL